MKLQLTQKEVGLLKDMKDQEQLCVQKYEAYAAQAHKEELKQLFGNIAATEREHLKTVTEMMGGSVTPVSGGALQANNSHCCAVGYSSESERAEDAFLLRDMLATEKHASSLYDVSVFEFSDPVARRVLNHIQSEEQQHGEQIYAYMKANGMYGG